MLTLRSAPLVTSVTGVPVRRPATSASALDCPPAHCAYCPARRDPSVCGAVAAMAVAASAREAASDAASARVRCIAVSFEWLHYDRDLVIDQSALLSIWSKRFPTRWTTACERFDHRDHHG